MIIKEPVKPEIIGKKQRARILMAIFGVIGIAIVAIVVVQLTNPYVITVNDKPIVMVQSENQAKHVVKQVMNDYKAEDSDIQSIETDKELQFSRKNVWDFDTDLPVMSKDEAVARIEKINSGEKPFFTATIVGQTANEEDYTPDIVYKKDEDMYAGESKVEKKGSDGKQIVTRDITTVNGEITDTQVVKTEVTEEGEAAVIYKGMLGLPEGEDWKTYEGDPVFEGAEDLINIAKKYQGAPYKYGGASLTNGIDCVQYVRAIYRLYGINLPNHHSGIRRSGYGVSYKNMKAGDVICYTGHVAIYIGNGKIIHASSNAGVHISKVYKGQKIVTIRRIVK